MFKRLRFKLPETVFTIALIVLLIQFGLALGEYVRHARAALTFPFPLDYGEGPILDQVLRLARAENIYRADISTPPYTVSNYPPLFHLAQAPLALIWGPAFWYGRAISMVSALAAALFIGLTLYTVTRDRVASIAGGLTLLAFPYILQWSAFDRVDTLALALSWAGLFAIVRWPDQRRGLALSVVLLAAAVYTKQSYGLVIPATALAWLLQGRRYRRALEWAGWLGGICLALFLVLNWITRGGFYFNIVTANVNQFSHIPIMAYLTEMLIQCWLLMLGAVLFMVVERWWYPTRSWPLVTPCVLLAGLASAAAGKAGSSINYLYEPASALCLAAGAILAWPGTASKNYWLKTAIVLGLALQINGMVNWSREDYVPFVMSKVHMSSEVAQLAQIVQDAPAPVLADEYMGLIPVAGRKLYLQPFEFSQLQQAGLWNAGGLIASIQRHEFSAILLYEPPFGRPMIVTRWTPALRNAIWSNYRPLLTRAHVWVYVPQE